MTTARKPVRWMALLTTDGEPPRGLPPGAVLIRLDSTPRAAPAAGETPLQAADELNSWPSSGPPAVKIPSPDYLAAIRARNPTHWEDTHV